MSMKGMKSSVVNESFDSHYEKCFLAQEDKMKNFNVLVIL